MEPILLVFLSSFLLTVNSHPRNSDFIPKDYYKRQILQPIPGYIPVYIKADGEPIIRSEKINRDSNAHFSKLSKAEGNQLPEVKSASVISDRMNTEIDIKALKNKLPKFSETSQRQINSSNGNRKFAQTDAQKLNNKK